MQGMEVLTDLVGKRVGSDQFISKFVACQTRGHSSVYSSGFTACPIRAATLWRMSGRQYSKGSRGNRSQIIAESSLVSNGSNFACHPRKTGSEDKPWSYTYSNNDVGVFNVCKSEQKVSASHGLDLNSSFHACLFPDCLHSLGDRFEVHKSA